MTSETRARRLAERIREELADLLRREVADPRLTLVSITDVEVDREFSVATIYVSALDDSQRMDEILTGFGRARGFLRHELAARIPVRAFPQLRFRHDPSAERGAHIEALIASLHPPKPTRAPKTKKAKTAAKGTKAKKATKGTKAKKAKVVGKGRRGS
ncbi:MAG TPA: 30S ribosome-binding factor RbfA [Anaerolineales bacterium]|nr:30S ribosome-binding factor RbfA [Anaerolineales bacterium]